QPAGGLDHVVAGRGVGGGGEEQQRDNGKNRWEQGLAHWNGGSGHGVAHQYGGRAAGRTPGVPGPRQIAHNRRMDRYERILALHRTFANARYPVTVARLQDDLGCSRATVYRDLAFLRDALMAPVVGAGEAGFRYDPDEADRFELPGLWL